MDPYSPCMCGSGKAFKWCCQPYYGDVDTAMNLQRAGQHEAALKLLADLTYKHPTIAQVWGYQAQLMIMNGQFEPAEVALDKAFDLNANFAFGYYLKAVIRQQEGETLGALLLFRRAAEKYDPKSADMLGEIYGVIANTELQLNRPVAARAALEKACFHSPADQEMKQAMQVIFGEESRIPEPARRRYTFRKPDETRAELWKDSLARGDGGQFADATEAFGKIVAEAPGDSAALFNLGLLLAWQGKNAEAIDGLYRSIEAEADDFRAAEAGALAEVLRCGAGMEEYADYHDYQIFYEVKNAQAVIDLLQEWESTSRIVGIRSDSENQTLTALILEDSPALGLGGSTMARLSAHLYLRGPQMRLNHTKHEAVEAVAGELNVRLAGAIREMARHRTIANWGDVVTEALMFPTGQGSVEVMQGKIREQSQAFFEEQWVDRPLRALNDLTPTAAALDPVLRKRLMGVLRFIEACFSAVKPGIQEGETLHSMSIYDFDRLRTKLHLLGAVEAAPLSLTGMSAEELLGVAVEPLSEAQLEEGYRAGLKLGSDEIATRFAEAIVGRPGAGDRYAWWNHLITKATDAGQAMSLLTRAIEGDATTNGGKRAGDFNLRRGQMLAKAGDIGAAETAFAELIAANPTELKYYGTATETMLSRKAGPAAVKFAEMGLAKARSLNNRDSEGYFRELLEAAQRVK